jgi:YHS domain-containing protein
MRYSPGDDRRCMEGVMGSLVPELDPQYADTAVDPVCGMTVELRQARADGLTAVHDGVEYAFCARGCMLDFLEDPASFVVSPGPKPA